MKGNEYFISGTDSACGKTYITGLLAYHLKKAGKEVITSKLVQTGGLGLSEDIKEHRWMMDIALLPEDKAGLTCPYVFSSPVSPHLAAKIDASKINIARIRECNDELLTDYELLLSEGEGGLMEALSSNYFSLDYIKDYKLPVILVCSSKPGSINQSLLSLELCKQKTLDLKLVVFNYLPKVNETIAEDARQVIRAYSEKIFPNVPVVCSKRLAKLHSIDQLLEQVFGLS